MSDRQTDRHRRSADHILPRERLSGSGHIADGVRNTVIICQSCNGWRAACLHCWAMASCIEAVAKVRGLPRALVYREWRIGKAVAAAGLDNEAADRRRVEARAKLLSAQEDHIRRARNALRVQAAPAVERIGLDEFVHPAETPAAQVWNFATLAKRYSGPITE